GALAGRVAVLIIDRAAQRAASLIQSDPESADVGVVQVEVGIDLIAGAVVDETGLLDEVLDILVVAADVERETAAQPLHNADVVAVRRLRFEGRIAEDDRIVEPLPEPPRNDILEGRALHERAV